MIKKYCMQDYYYVSTVKEHLDYKIKLIDAIESMPSHESFKPYENLTNQDYRLPEDFPRPYLDLFYEMVVPYVKDLGNLLGFHAWQIHNAWFQQYYNNDSHDWHNHACVNFTNIYYLELPSQELVTELYDPHSKKIVNLEGIEEGQFVTFPGHWIHRSPKNLTNERKTIVAFNTSYGEVDFESINKALADEMMNND